MVTVASRRAQRQGDLVAHLSAALSAARAPRTPGRVSPRDAAVAAAAGAAGLLLYSPGNAGAGPEAWPTAVYIVSTLAQCVPLVWRRQRPELVTATVVGAALLHATTIGPVSPWPSWFALYAVALYTSPLQRAVAVTAVALAGAAVVFVTGPAVHGRAASGLLLTLVLTVVAVLLAALVRTERDRLEALRQRAAALERERDAAAREATVQERLRIARDLHDLVGHGLSSMAVQSSTARLLIDSGDVPAARDRMLAVEASSRSAMQEMRQLLGVLRDEGGPERMPSPTAAQVPRLIDAVRDAGLAVSLVVEGELDGVPPDVGLTAYRIVQESLTNAMKHAPGATVDVRVDVRSDQVRLEVRDRGASSLNLSGRAGHGLMGIRERVAALDGLMEAGPTCTGDGWRVAAVLPAGRTS